MKVFASQSQTPQKCMLEGATLKEEIYGDTKWNVGNIKTPHLKSEAKQQTLTKKSHVFFFLFLFHWNFSISHVPSERFCSLTLIAIG